SGGASFFSMIGGQALASSALIWVYCFWSSGTSSSAKIASTGHSATHSVQSMHSSGSITRKFGPSRKQSTGHTSTQSVYLHLMQDSVTTWVIAVLGSNGPRNALGPLFPCALQHDSRVRGVENRCRLGYGEAAPG